MPETAQASETLVPDATRNFIADMEPSTLLATRDRCLMSVPLTDAVRAPDGGASLGVLMSLFDVAASEPALVACNPDWTATQDLSVHGAGWLDEGPVVVDCRLVRVGKRVIVVSAEIYDGRGLDDLELLRSAIDDGGADLGFAGRGLLTFVRLPRTAASGVDDHFPERWLGEVRKRGGGTPAEGSMYDRMGLTVVDAGTGCYELARTSYVANSIGTINGGAQAVLAQVAAEAARPGRSAVDMQLHYLSQVKVGPARSCATVLRDTDDHTVVDVRLVDAGNSDQLLALATVTLRERV